MPHPPAPGNESSSKSSTDLLAVARVTSAHGLRGEVRLESLSGENEHLFTLGQAYLDSVGDWRALQVRGGGKRLIASIGGITDPDSAAALRGTLLLVARSQAAPLASDEYYVADLVGMDVMYRLQRRGTVTGVWDSGADAMLEVALEDGGERHVPLNRQFVRAVRRRQGSVVLRVDWILE